MLTSTNAILPTNDLDRTVAFYTSMGFHLHARYTDSGYLIFTRDGLELHFAHDPDHVAKTSDHVVYFRTDTVDEISAALADLDWVKEGFPRFGPAEDRPWGMREIHVLDPDGHLLRIGQDIT